MRAKVVTVMRWYAQDEVNQEDSEQNEVDGMKKGADSTGKVMHMWKSGWWFVMRKIRMVELGWQIVSYRNLIALTLYSAYCVFWSLGANVADTRETVKQRPQYSELVNTPHTHTHTHTHQNSVSQSSWLLAFTHDSKAMSQYSQWLLFVTFQKC